MSLVKELKKLPVVRNEKFKMWYRNMFMTFKRTYSQSCEDLHIYNFIKTWNEGGGMDNISYMDIGANDPIWNNNTYLFYKLGYKGVLIEANPRLCRRIKKIRPRDQVLNIGVHTAIGDSEEFLDFYIFEDHGLSTFSKIEMEHTQSLGLELKEVKKVRVVSINSMMKKYGVPTLLSIDVEGLDFEIIKTMDFDRYRPLVLVVESVNYGIPIHMPERKREDLINYIKQNGYMPYADTEVNSIFFDKNAVNL